MFAFKFTSRSLQPDIVYYFHILPAASTTLAELVAKFAGGVVDTSGAPWLANISANFRKNRNGLYRFMAKAYGLVH